VFEHKSQPLISGRAYADRLVRSAVAGIGLLIPSLAIGMLGYHGLEHLSWLDAFVDSSMLLGGMGPVHPPATEAGKLFAGTYAMFCGLVVILVAGVMISPMIHRAMHRFHLEQESNEDAPRPRKH
jgi:hypothetical protein